MNTDLMSMLRAMTLVAELLLAMHGDVHPRHHDHEPHPPVHATGVGAGE